MSDTQTAILAGGCFWCTEAVMNDVIGVTVRVSDFFYPRWWSPSW